MDLSTTEQELYDYLNARTNGATIEDVKKHLGLKHIGAIGKLKKIKVIKKEKRKNTDSLGEAIKMLTYYVIMTEEDKNEEIK